MTGWHFGPTASDPDPGKMWHYDCGREVLYLDGYICGCGQEWDDDGEPLAAPALLGFANYQCAGHAYTRPVFDGASPLRSERCLFGHGEAVLTGVDPVGGVQRSVVTEQKTEEAA